MEPHSEKPEPVLEHSVECTPDDGFAQRAARAFFLEVALLPYLVLSLVAGAIGAAVIVLILDEPVAFGVAAGLVAAGVALVTGWVQTRRRIVAQIHPGAPQWLGMDTEWLHMRSVNGAFVMPYSGFRRVKLRGDVVLLQQRATPLWVIFPRALLPGEALTMLRARVAAAGHDVGAAR